MSSSLQSDNSPSTQGGGEAAKKIESPRKNKSTARSSSSTASSSAQIGTVVISSASSLSPTKTVMKKRGLQFTKPIHVTSNNRSDSKKTKKTRSSNKSNSAKKTTKKKDSNAEMEKPSTLKSSPSSLTSSQSYPTTSHHLPRLPEEKKEQQLQQEQEQEQEQEEEEEDFHRIYGIKIRPQQPRQDDKSETICEGCEEPCDMELSEPILLCDGYGCTREYHLKCIDPPLKSIPKGDFYCVHCDALGSSMHLKQYFDDCAEARSDFPSSKTFVESLTDVHLGNPIKKSSILQEGQEDDAQSKVYDDCMTKLRKLVPDSKQKQLKEEERVKAPESELDKIIELYNTAMNDDSWAMEKNGGISGGGNNEAGKTLEDFGPELFVGKSLRLYCPDDNSYHNGRIIDWRSALSADDRLKMNELKRKEEDLFYGKHGNISSTEFLVRFPSGINGRKQTVCQWLIFEEHSCAICMFMIMGQRDRGRGVNGWRPAQILLRTSLELVPFRKEISTDGHWGLGAFFGDGSNEYLNLDTEVVGLFSRRFAEYKREKIRTTSTKHQEFHDNAFRLLMHMARNELEEQHRAFEWHTLSLQNYAHRNALSLRNEYSLDAITVERMERDKTLMEEIKKEQKRPWLLPKLCPLTQHGIDRQWLADQLVDDDVEKSLDTIASFSCTPTPINASLMARLQKKN